MKKIIKENIIPITIWTIFEIIAITLFLSKKKIFYLSIEIFTFLKFF